MEVVQTPRPIVPTVNKAKQHKALKSAKSYSNTVNRTGKWRGKKAAEYKKYKFRKKMVDPYASLKFIISLHPREERMEVLRRIHKEKQKELLTTV